MSGSLPTKCLILPLLAAALLCALAGFAYAAPPAGQPVDPALAFGDETGEASMVVPGSAPVGGSPGSTATFDAVDKAGGKWLLGETNEQAARLAWSESYVISSYLAMYEATGERRYLDKFMLHANAAVANSDVARGVADYRGRSTGAWRCGNTYTVAKAAFRDGRGRPVMNVFSRWYSVNNHSLVRVGRTSSTFSLRGRNPWVGNEVFASMSLNPRGGNYAPRRVNSSSMFLAVRRTGYGLKYARALPRATGWRRPVPMYYHFVCQTALVAYPLVRFYNIVKSDATLTASLEATAARYLSAARLAVAAHDDEWVNAGRMGYYRFRRGAPVWSDGVGVPHNKSLAMGRTLIELYAATGKPVYKDRATRIARQFKRYLKRNVNNAYLWNYWWGRGDKGWRRNRSPSTYTPLYEANPRYEDLGHGGIDVEFVAAAAKAGIVLTRRDAIRFANTLCANMRLSGDRVAFYCNGTGSEQTPSRRKRVGVAGWYALAPFSRDVYRLSNVSVGRGLRTLKPSVVLLYAVARSVQARQVLAASSQPLRSPRMRVLKGPRSGNRVRGTFVVQLYVSSSGRARVAFFNGGRRVRTVRSAPYRCRFSTGGLSNGMRLFRAVATEPEGRTSVLRLYYRVSN